MEISTSTLHGKEPVAVIKIKGEIVASNYVQVVNKAQELYNNPCKYLLIDLTEVTSISSAGMAGLHKISLIYSGVSTSTTEEAEAVLNATHSNRARKFIRLINPQPEVDKALIASGMKLFFKTFTDVDSALESF